MAVGKERISTEDHPWTEDLTVPSHQAMVPPTLPRVQEHPTRPCQPADRWSLSSNQRGVDLQWMLRTPGAHQDHQAPPGLALWFLPQDHMRGQEQRQEQSSAVLTNGLLLLYTLDNSSSAKDSGCCEPKSKESSVSFDARASFHPHGSTGQEKHAHGTRSATPKGPTPSHVIPPELTGLLGICLSLNIYIYMYV